MPQTLFKGWYREQLVRGKWHCMINDKISTTVCGRLISPTNCDFDIRPDLLKRCKRCAHKEHLFSTSDQIFAPVGETSIPTKTSAIHELRRLSKPRTYLVSIWDIYGVKITAQWKSDVSIDIDTELIVLTRNNKSKVVTLDRVKEDLGRFKTAIDCLCDASDGLALEVKRKKGLKGKLTPTESYAFFEELLYEKEKTNV